MSQPHFLLTIRTFCTGCCARISLHKTSYTSTGVLRVLLHSTVLCTVCPYVSTFLPHRARLVESRYSTRYKDYDSTLLLEGPATHLCLVLILCRSYEKKRHFTGPPSEDKTKARNLPVVEILRTVPGTAKTLTLVKKTLC
jgi:hypothetical protein